MPDAAVAASPAATLMRDAAATMPRDPAAALRLLRQAAAIAPQMLEVHLNIALACRATADEAGALAAFDEVLARDPHHFIALLSKAAMMETAAGPHQAARAYRAALQVAPPAAQLPPALTAALDHARAAVAADTHALQAHLRQATAALRPALHGEAAARFDESLDVFAGAARVFTQKPLLLHYSRLPSIPFYDRALFPWLAELEAATPVIQAELHDVLADTTAEFTPYVQFPRTAAVNQWGGLNHSRRWSSFFLWQNGTRHDEACRRCPATAALMERLPLQRQPGFAPTVMFSALEPHTRIPPHTGSATTRLLCHLPLILPGPARFRVGAQTREWRLGEAWVFDDTIEHEAWNDADAMRVILIIDIWSPFLSSAETELVGAMMQARNDWYG